MDLLLLGLNFLFLLLNLNHLLLLFISHYFQSILLTPEAPPIFTKLEHFHFRLITIIFLLLLIVMIITTIKRFIIHFAIE